MHRSILNLVFNAEVMALWEAMIFALGFSHGVTTDLKTLRGEHSTGSVTPAIPTGHELSNACLTGKRSASKPKKPFQTM